MAELDGTAPAWAQWVERWHATSTLTPRVRAHRARCILAKVGRWLAAEHPEAADPAHWTRQTCAAWVAARGPDARRRLRPAQRPGSATGREAARARDEGGPPDDDAATFFRDCQEWEWIPRRFDPARALAALRAASPPCIGPDPRVIADEVWAKLLWAGLNLDRRRPARQPGRRPATRSNWSARSR